MNHENANLIIPRLWLGNKKAALDNRFLQDNNITVVFNCTKDIPFTNLPVAKYRVPVDDNLQPAEIQNLLNWAPEIVYKVLNEYKQGKTILIHCYAGVQRSAAVMAMTLMVIMRSPSDVIIPYIREKRPIAFFPQANFGRSIVEFEKWLNKEAAKPSRSN